MHNAGCARLQLPFEHPAACQGDCMAWGAMFWGFAGRHEVSQTRGRNTATSQPPLTDSQLSACRSLSILGSHGRQQPLLLSERCFVLLIIGKG